MKVLLSTFIFFLFTLLFSLSLSNPNPEETDALLAFKASSDRSNSLASWVKSTGPCSGSWLGVTCDPKTRRITKLVLENFNLTGSIQPLTQLDYLSVLSLKHNLLSSSLNLSSWPHLNHLYLSHNSFTGTIPAAISRLRHLRRLDLSYNQLSGEIPLAKLIQFPRLLTLRLESNSFTGFDYSPNPSSISFKDFNVSDNNLTGEVPLFLTKFGLPSFLGNEQLCGKPLPHICPNPTAVNPSTRTAHPDGKHHGSNHAVLISVSVAIGVLVIAGAVKRWRRRRTKRSEVGCGTPPKVGNGYDYVRRHYGSKKLKSVGANCSSYGPRVPNESVGGAGDMVVLEGCNPSVGKVGDLLRASAEMLGMGSMGATYKIMIDGHDDIVVVKRVRERRVHGKEVDGLLRLIGELRHSNIVSLRAYHNSNRELLLVYDFLPNGSLNSLLHGNRGPGRTPLDWSTRLKVASGSAQALAFLHDYCDKAQVFHGHVTSSNILIDPMGNACVADIGLQQLLAGPSPSYNPYKAPELIMPSSFSPNKYTRKCDVYSFGVVLMEILTGRMAGEEGEMGLVEWVNAAVKEDCNTWEVFDFELLSDKEMEEEMWALFQVGLLCLAAFPKDRPTMNMVHNMIEDIRKKGVREDGTSKSILDDISYDSSSSSSTSSSQTTS